MGYLTEMSGVWLRMSGFEWRTPRTCISSRLTRAPVAVSATFAVVGGGVKMTTPLNSKTNSDGKACEKAFDCS